MGSAPSSYVDLAVGKLEFRVDPYVKALRISFCLDSPDPTDIGLHFGLEFAEVVVVDLLVGPHGQTCISHPVVVVGSSGGGVVRGGHDTSFSLDIDVLIEESVHFIVE